MMEQVPLTPKDDSSTPPIADGSASQTNEQMADLADLEKQAEYRREYLTQLRRRACPGCGETDSIY